MAMVTVHETQIQGILPWFAEQEYWILSNQHHVEDITFHCSSVGRVVTFGTLTVRDREI